MLEITLLILFVLLILAVAGFISYQRNQKLASAFERELDQNDEDKSDFHARFDAVFAEFETSKNGGEQPIAQDGESISDVQTPESESTLDGPVIPDKTQSVLPEPEWELVVALTVVAPKGRLFTGRAVKNALDNQDLHFGDMQIYHRFSLGSRKQSLFSVANIIDPGTFLPAELISMKTPGILFFARLPGPINGLAVLDAMLDCARQMAEQLDGIVCDEERQPLSDEVLEGIRARIFELNLNLQKDTRQYEDL